MAIDGIDIVRSLAALAIVLGLVLLLAWAARRFLPSIQAQTSGKRLGIIEQRALDPRNRLVLVRHDRCEHLLVVGPAGTTVVSTNRPAGPADEH